MEDGGQRKKPHVVMLPLMAQGHIIPFFELAKLLAKRADFLVTIVNTPRNIARLQVPVSSTCKAHGIDIRLEELPFPKAIEGLPPNVENTDSLPYNLMFLLVRSCEQLENPFETLLRRLSQDYRRRPTCIISDMFFGWTLDVANRMGIHRLTFMTMGAFATSSYYSLWLHLPHMKTDSDTFSLAPDLPHVWLHKSQLPLSLKLTNNTDPWYLFLSRQIQRNLRSWGTLVNTFEELEPAFVDHMRGSNSGNVWSIGPVLPSGGSTDHTRLIDESVEATCLEWLDSLPPLSVVYISFGTQVRISYSQMQELALGLESSGKPFVWVVRPPVEVADGCSFLPSGFEERIEKSKQGLLLRTWAPQLTILSHPSTGAFLSHCGWNSVLESLSHGVPLIGWPLAADQFYNSKLLEEEVGVSVEICRGADGQLNRADVERTVKMVTEGDKASTIRKKAMEMRNASRQAFAEEREKKGSSIANIDKFSQEIYKIFLSRYESSLEENCH